jgi:hypothetical protein
MSDSTSVFSVSEPDDAASSGRPQRFPENIQIRGPRGLKDAVWRVAQRQHQRAVEDPTAIRSSRPGS